MTPDTGRPRLIDILPRSAVGLQLVRITRKGDKVRCEAIRFEEGFDAVELTLRRAAISGRVEVGKKGTTSHFADVLDSDGSIVATVRWIANLTARSRTA